MPSMIPGTGWMEEAAPLISSGTGWADEAAPLISSCTCIWIPEIHLSSTSDRAPPSGFVLVARFPISSRYVPSPCPFVPVSFRSGDRSASITTKFLSMT